ncbi:MAG: hypothetical protein H6712_10305 [Myxococcales bacterium]|nr:hypothetical protein [Myxococcales bacterium]MCB9714239.1 hypothetical protein [Myxococcales bacterium]
MLVTTGCFGDWVSARPRARRDEPPVAERVESPTPADPCRAYLHAVAEHCEGILDGHPHERACHPEVVRVMALFHDGEEPLDHQPRATGESRDQTCARYLRTMPEPHEEGARAVELGPRCRAWALEIRERCVAPLATLPPALEACGSDLLAFESALGGITFGRATDYESLCEDAVTRLRDEPTSSSETR